MKIGQKVVCIESRQSPICSTKITEGEIYIVKDYDESSWSFPSVKVGDQIGFWYAKYFKPLEPTSVKHEFTNEVTKELTREFEEVPETLEKEIA